ncbi:MAG: phytanoyl-CoA dioxygenase family protein [Armatimonadetes bacterium]|nr:phytanoyl-CoA dioxygenase family protein [Armatimonadota bacterium]
MYEHFTEDQWREYDREGYLRLGKVLTDDELKGLQTRIDDIMLGKVRYRDMMMQLDLGGGYDNTAPQSKGWKGETLEYRKIEQLEKDPLFLAYMRKPLFRDLCAFIYGAHNGIAAYRSMFMNKPARKGTVLPYHQDGGEIWKLDRDPLLTIWLALDPATIANGCVKVFPRTHRLGLLSKFGHTISDENLAKHCPEEKAVPIELEAGEAFIMHNWTIHGSDINNTDIPRRGFSVCFMDSRTTYLPTGERFPVVFGEGAMEPEEPELVGV